MLKYILLNKSDEDISLLKELHNLPAIKKFISISDNYFSYVTTTENVWYYKILQEDIVVGAVHLEKYDDVMYLSIWIRPEFQQKGYARIALDYVEKNLCKDTHSIQVSIEEDNVASLRLFERVGYTFVGSDEELRDYKKEINLH